MELLLLILLIWRDNYVVESISDYITDIIINDIKIFDDRSPKKERCWWRGPGRQLD
jgi:hypothetical protein